MSNCSVCFEENNDLKCLPCWHLFCQSCLRQIRENERTMKCPICRNICLSNTEALPNPVTCHSCDDFVVNPKRFEPCLDVYCSECLLGLDETIEGQKICGICQTTQEGGIKSMSICQRCHCINSDDNLPCRHSLCVDCFQQNRECDLCKVIVEEQARENAQQQRIFADQLLRTMIQTNNFLHSQNNSQPRNNINQNQSENEKDFTKSFMFLFCFCFPVYYWGLCSSLWLVSIVIYSVTRPPHTHMIVMTWFCVIVLQTISFYQYFYATLLITSLNGLQMYTTNRWWCFGDKSKKLFRGFIGVISGVYLPIYYSSYFPNYLIHQFCLGIFIGVIHGINESFGRRVN